MAPSSPRHGVVGVVQPQPPRALRSWGGGAFSHIVVWRDGPACLGGEGGRESRAWRPMRGWGERRRRELRTKGPRAPDRAGPLSDDPQARAVGRVPGEGGGAGRRGDTNPHGRETQAEGRGGPAEIESEGRAEETGRQAGRLMDGGRNTRHGRVLMHIEDTGQREGREERDSGRERPRQRETEKEA